MFFIHHHQRFFQWQYFGYFTFNIQLVQLTIEVIFLTFFYFYFLPTLWDFRRISTTTLVPLICFRLGFCLPPICLFDIICPHYKFNLCRVGRFFLQIYLHFRFQHYVSTEAYNQICFIFVAMTPQTSQIKVPSSTKKPMAYYKSDQDIFVIIQKCSVLG